MRATTIGAAVALGLAALAFSVPARADQSAPAPRPAPRPAAPYAPTGATVSVGVSVPPVVFGGGSRLLVHVHPSAGSATATVRGCAPVGLPLGVVVALPCPATPSGAVTVRVTTADGTTYVHTYPVGP